MKKFILLSIALLFVFLSLSGETSASDDPEHVYKADIQVSEDDHTTMVIYGIPKMELGELEIHYSPEDERYYFKPNQIENSEQDGNPNPQPNEPNPLP